MIEAGLEALFPNSVLDWQDEEEVVARIYRAMHAARHATDERSGLQSEETNEPSLRPHPATEQ